MPHIVQATVVGMKEILELNVVFLRHGETDANKYKICQGQSDYPLNSNGINAATKTGETFQNREWSLVYSSDLSRAYDTAKLALAGCLAAEKHTSTALLRERSQGILEGLPKPTAIEDARKIQSERLNCSIEEIVDRIETFSDVIERQKQFLQTLLVDMISNADETRRGQTIDSLVVTHGRFIKIFLGHFCSLEVNEIKNCSATTVRLVFSKLNSDSDNLTTALDTSHSDSLSSLSNQPASPLCEWIVDGKFYCLETVIPIDINNTSHLNEISSS